MSTNTSRNDERLSRIALANAKDRAGKGWALLGEQIQEALVLAEACAIISQNEENSGWERAAALVDEAREGFRSDVVGYAD